MILFYGVIFCERWVLPLWGVDTHRIPQRHLPLAHATEAGAQDLPVGHEHGPDGPGALVRFLLLLRQRRIKEFLKVPTTLNYFYCQDLKIVKKTIKFISLAPSQQEFKH